MKAINMYIGEGFEGPGGNAAHINILIGPKDGPVGNAWAGSITSPTRGHRPFMVIAQPNVPVKPVTLFTNKAEIEGELHGKATWGAAQAGIAKGRNRGIAGRHPARRCCRGVVHPDCQLGQPGRAMIWMPFTQIIIVPAPMPSRLHCRARLINKI